MRGLRCCFCGRTFNTIGGLVSKTTEEAICNECIAEIVIFRAANMESAKRLKEIKEETNDKN